MALAEVMGQHRISTLEWESLVLPGITGAISGPLAVRGTHSRRSLLIAQEGLGAEDTCFGKVSPGWATAVF